VLSKSFDKGSNMPFLWSLVVGKKIKLMYGKCYRHPLMSFLCKPLLYISNIKI